MPVRKFRDVAEMEAEIWYEPGDPRLALAIRSAWAFARRTLRPTFPPGVYKHRTIESANRLAEEWDRENFERFRRERERRQRS